MGKEHYKWIDIARAIGIVAVVMGHGYHELAHHYTYWFHMPLFFILSGFLYKPLNNMGEFASWVGKRAVRLLLPYLTFGIIIYLYIELKEGFTVVSFMEDMYNLMYGGMMMKGLVTVFWFMTCLLITQIVFALIDLIFRSHAIKIGIIILSYLFAHLYAYYQPIETPVPWSADVTFIALSYYAFGYYIKKYIHKVLNLKTFIVTALLTIMFVIYDYKNNYFYNIDLKPNVYNHLLLDFLVPVIICFTIFYISAQIAKFKSSVVISYIGTSAITIMFLHRVVNDFFSHFFSYGIIGFTLIGVLTPFIFYILIKQVPFARFLFLGTRPRKKYEYVKKASA
ncbi:acyltransferase family protein [Aciduricibacillus chroicocephali]|uniref:Acyltransferase family protein n=1 Tax=Aciduricibacillus chroicocephali TaxID=3054939 RepID=A0ABY9KUA5_9BACI|nr:acyltransferase family protein [Bacillaceae bacterium 44XB]